MHAEVRTNIILGHQRPNKGWCILQMTYHLHVQTLSPTITYQTEVVLENWDAVIKTLGLRFPIVYLGQVL